MTVHDQVISSDGTLRVTLLVFDSKTGQGRLRIEELRLDHARFYVTAIFGQGGQHRIDYKTYDVHKQTEFVFFTNRNDTVKEINIVRVSSASTEGSPA